MHMQEFSQPEGIPLGTEASAAEKQSEMGKRVTWQFSSYIDSVFLLHVILLSKTVNVHNIK